MMPIRPASPRPSGRRVLRRLPRQGVGLIEVLVSVLVVSVGLLGAAAMQAASLRNNQGSYDHAQSTVATQAILDAMRSNPAGVTAGSYNTVGFVCTAPTTSNLATRDLARWITGMQATMGPSACGSVTCNGAGECVVRVRWDDSRSSGGSAALVAETGVLL
jgi:type IV pilus assembly protein PilV